MNDLDRELANILKEFGVDLESSVPIYRQLNSVTLVELVLRLESAFHFEMSPMEYDPQQFSDFNNIREMLQNKSTQ